MKSITVIIASTLIILSLIFYLRGQSNQKEVELDKEMKTETVRKPAVAGTFYPGNKEELQKELNNLMSSNDKSSMLNVKLIIVPHAGYEFSGSVAAAGFSQIKGQKVNRVILLGASHQSWFDGAAIDDRNFWQTPLGNVPVDLDFAKKLIAEENKISFSSSAHDQEHSLEVELPFLQTVLSDFQIVPVLLGNTDNQTLESLAKIISQNLDQETIIVVSTDLSHYPDYETANKVDQKTIESILSKDEEKFTKTLNDQMAAGYPNLETCVCAQNAVKVAMIIAKSDNQGSWQLIKYANSGDASGEKSRVVGYAAIAWITENQSSLGASNESPFKDEENYNLEQRQLLLKIARETLESYLKNKTIPQYEIKDEKLNEKLGAFVTLNKNGQLRGCIGEFSPAEAPLWQIVQQKAIDAALNDPRFSPVSYDELREIEIEISVLSVPEKIDDWRKIETGKHGVIIRQGMRGGTFLPQVATETGWSKEEFLSQLCSQKAGLPANCYQDPKTEILTYTAEVFSE